MVCLSILATIDLIILNSLAGQNIFKTVSRTFPPGNHTGFVIFFPSISIAVIVLETSLISSL